MRWELSIRQCVSSITLSVYNWGIPSCTTHLLGYSLYNYILPPSPHPPPHSLLSGLWRTRRMRRKRRRLKEGGCRWVRGCQQGGRQWSHTTPPLTPVTRKKGKMAPESHRWDLMCCVQGLIHICTKLDIHNVYHMLIENKMLPKPYRNVLVSDNDIYLHTYKQIWNQRTL